jgi:lysozyme family protein
LKAIAITFERIIENVLKSEGGYVNDPNDPGGETNFGIAKRFHKSEDIKNMTKKRAIEIYKSHYWEPSKVERLPQEIQYSFFDSVVNCGSKRSVKILQRCCNSLSKSKLPVKLEIDGRIGRKTISASQKVSNKRFKAFRVLYYANLVQRKPQLERYFYGWFRRATHDLK